MKKTASSPDQLLLNLTTSCGVVTVPQPGGAILVRPGKVMIEGSVKDAMRVLGLPDVKTVYRLIEDGEIVAWKPRNTAKNCKYRVQMASVYALKERRLAEVSYK